MKKILRNYFNALLVLFALIFVALIFGYFSWGVGYLLTEVNGANNRQSGNAAASGFDLKGAAALDYKGILPPAAPTSS